jgi:uncharacterized membrane protein YhaH (DUF805 family)
MRLLFWILMLLWLVIGLGGPFYFVGAGISHVYVGGSLILYLLVGLLGWKTFGKPIEN